MIDTHCHVLPGLDDGARSLAESILMVRRLEEGGVRHVICTPHFSRRFNTDVVVAGRARDELALSLEQLGIEVALTAGAEIDPLLALHAPIEQIRDRSIAAGYVLVEALPNTPAQMLRNIARRLGEAGLAIVIAHPERCRALQKDPRLIDDLRSCGALIQIVVPSLTGSAEAAVGRAAWRMIMEGRADLVATDGHRPESSRLRLAAVADVVGSRVGQSAALDLFVHGPRRVVAGVGIHSET